MGLFDNLVFRPQKPSQFAAHEEYLIEDGVWTWTVIEPLDGGPSLYGISDDEHRAWAKAAWTTWLASPDGQEWLDDEPGRRARFC